MKPRLQQGKKFNKVHCIPLVLCLGIVCLWGCSDAEKSAVRPASVASKATSTLMSQAIPTAEEKKVQPQFVYNAVGRRDPFAPLISRTEVKERASARPPLERYNISEFKLTGIVWGGFGYNAMVEGPDGKGYFVRVGTVIGPNKGTIKKITKDTMVIEEKFKNYMGKIERKQIVIEMRKKQEGM